MRCSGIECCCGRDDCARLQHNAAALEGLEKDVDSAARVGQALLERHESYVAEAESVRSKMRSEIDDLEDNKRDLLSENSRLIEDNRNLVGQLEELNHALSESDAYIKSLETTLESSQLEVRRLTVSASRAAQLEEQLGELEAEQAGLQDKLAGAEENEKSAIQRWKKTESALEDLQDQLDKMERESRDEQKRHAELLGQMEKKRSDEGRVRPAAAAAAAASTATAAVGRLKTTGSAGALGRQANGTNVVSDFVGDILQDNANLQTSVAELKEMLQNSDQEIHDLREQIMLHQPLDQVLSGGTPKRNNLLPLSEELRRDSPTPPVSQEFHVHHHYHGASQSPQPKRDKPRGQIHRHHKRRRPVFPPTLLESPSRESTSSRRPASHTPRDSNSSASTVLSSLSLSMPASGHNHRWSSSTASQVLSSSSSSPQSMYPSESIFDRVDRGFESSRPTSPEGTEVSSPSSKGRHHPHRPSDTSMPSVFETEIQDQVPRPMTPTTQHTTSLTQIATEAETRPAYDVSEHPGEHTPTPSKPIMGFGSQSESPQAKSSRDSAAGNPTQFSSSVPTGNNFGRPTSPHHRTAKRSAAQGSLSSFPAMDVHSSVPHRPGQYYGSHFDFSPKPPDRVSSAGAIFSSVDPVISRTNITIPKISVNSGEGNDKSSVALLSSVASAATKPQNRSPARSSGAPRSIGKRVGSWMFERWSGTFPQSTTDTHSSATSNASDTSSFQSSEARSAQTTAPIPFPTRLPGVNQKGLISWLRPPAKAPSSVQPAQLDEELLQESLQE